MSKKSIFCIATSHNQAERIVNQLKVAVFSNSDISVLFRDKVTTYDFSQEKNTQTIDVNVTCVGAGNVLGGPLGWIAGIGPLEIPGVGPFIAAGPNISAVGRGIAGGLIGLGLPVTEARSYEGKVTAGNILIAAHADHSKEIDRAKSIFAQAGAEDIGSPEDSPRDGEAAVRANYLPPRLAL